MVDYDVMVDMAQDINQRTLESLQEKNRKYTAKLISQPLNKALIKKSKSNQANITRIENATKLANEKLTLLQTFRDSPMIDMTCERS